MTKYINPNEFLRKYSNSPVEFKMYIGFRIQSDPEFKLAEIGGESKEVLAKNRVDVIFASSMDKIKNGDKNIGIICDMLDSLFVYQIKVNKIADVEFEIIEALERMQHDLPELAAEVNINGSINDILIIDVWNEYKLNDKFCIKKA